ncbi:hypothetical protein L3Y34_007142 [Caenorhabditis briggsae]|uniref:Nuclear receptor domain-containing protein n=1 Tax=Caenorhabditis briggsae TaxID=6238 RepID=A0AAE9CZB9_CAEBR|nr:hypothetical protein L3Y34_007142 [Caenorhabditis briggsae]
MEVIQIQICQVCGAQGAHGNHFGAISCRACAAFFRRTAFSKWSTSNCRNGCCTNYKYFCKPCRLKRCFNVGMETSNFQYNRDSLFSRNVPTSLPKFVGRPEVVLFWDAEKPNQKSYIDVKFLVQKASEIFGQDFKNVYVRDSSLKRLSMGLKESEKKNLDGLESLSTINQSVVSDTWQYYFLTVATWLMHFEEFQKLEDTVKLKILETIWHIWATLDRHCATASYRRSHPYAPKTQIISRRGVLLDLTKVQFDSTWLSDYPSSEIAYFLRQNSSDHFDIIGALLELEPSDMEITFILGNALAKSVDPFLNFECLVVLFEKLDVVNIWKMIQRFISRDLPIGSSFYFHSERHPKLVDVFKMHNRYWSGWATDSTIQNGNGWKISINSKYGNRRGDVLDDSET